MAQHYKIQDFPQKRFRDIERGIRSNFKRAYGMRVSNRYMFSEVLTKAYRKPWVEVYMARYKIPKSVWGRDYGDFEIHYNIKTKEVEEIYLPL